MKIFSGIPSVSDMGRLAPYFPGGFFGFVYSDVSKDMIFAVAGVLCPAFVEIEDRVHVLSLQDPGDFNIPFNQRFCVDKKSTERYGNILNLSEYPNLMGYEADISEDMIPELAKVLEYFWGRRLKELFPDRVFEFELVKDLYDEDEWSFTFSQK